MHLQTYPIFGVEMAVGRTYPFSSLHQLGDALGLTFHDNGPEVIDVTLTKRVADGVEGQHRVTSRHLGERQLFLNIAQ